MANNRTQAEIEPNAEGSNPLPGDTGGPPSTAGAASQERTPNIVRGNLARIEMVVVNARLLRSKPSFQRVLSVLQRRRDWALGPPLVVLATDRSDPEKKVMHSFTTGPAVGLAKFIEVDRKSTVGTAIKIYQQNFDANADAFQAKRHLLFLTRRGGEGKPEFVSPFTAGKGTTCGEWTRPMLRSEDGVVTKGFMKAAVAVGFCPVECPYCYLQTTYTEGMDIALNLEDLARELRESWQRYRYPINFGETSGLVEYDEWFSDANGAGSIIQFVIDASARAEITPFFLTKIRYPRYLKFNGKVQVGISLMPEAVRQWAAPYGSPADELLASLAWTVSAGAVDPVIRLTVIWDQINAYPDLLQSCRDSLGKSNWRLTLDIMRFTPNTASIIAARYPKPADRFARELSPDATKSLADLAREGRGEKKIRPSAERQAEIFHWFRDQLDSLGCPAVMLTPCKGDPEELTPLVHQKVIRSMPCACYGVTTPKPNTPPKPGTIQLPMVS